MRKKKKMKKYIANRGVVTRGEYTNYQFEYVCEEADELRVIRIYLLVLEMGFYFSHSTRIN